MGLRVVQVIRVQVIRVIRVMETEQGMRDDERGRAWSAVSTLRQRGRGRRRVRCVSRHALGRALPEAGACVGRQV
ncbi:hypothetical protein GCM10010298_24900 [Streptomyces microflavus]|nr:hypothetical protein GCM10010298_24900 [Streptomyces microflavus]